MNGVEELLGRIARLRLIVIGDVMLDHYIWGDATRISPEAPVPVVHVDRETDTPGGAANVASNVSSLGAQVEVYGCIGKDANGRKLIGHLKQKNVAFDEELLSDRETITKTRVIVRNQQLCRLDRESVPRVYRDSVIPHLEQLKKKISAVDAVILSDYAKGVLTTDLIRELTAHAHQAGKFISLDPKPSSGNESRDLDLMTPNRKEALELSGLAAGADDRGPATAKLICEAIWKRYQPRNLVITQGPQGMLLSREGGILSEIPTAARQVYDVSGAGDTVIAALTLAMVAGATLEDAAHFANAAAGVVVGKLGTATVTPQELVDYVNHR